MAQLEVKKTSGGQVMARRLDGHLLTLDDREEARRLVEIQESLPPIRARVSEEVRSGTGDLQGIKICSTVLDVHLWLIVDRSFNPSDNLAQYYVEELSELKRKSVEDLQEIHCVKLVFPGARVVQQGPQSGACDGR